MTVDADVEGLPQFQASMRQASDQLADLAPDEAGRLVQQRAASGAPKLTGALARSIQASSSGAEVTIGSDLDYAGIQEFGTGRVRAQPYLRPALADSTSAVLATYEAEVGKAIGQVHGT